MKLNLRQYFPELFPIEKTTTEHNYLEVNRRRGRLVLDSKNVNYSFGALHRVFQRAFTLAKPDLSPCQNALVLGFGAGSVAFILQKELKFQGTLTGVEIDPGVIALSRKYFGLDQISRLELKIADAYDYVFSEKTTYDLIVVDLFIDHIIPEKFDRKEFLDQLQRILNKEGMLFFNRMDVNFSDRDRIQNFRATMQEVFQNVRISDEFNIDHKNLIFYIKK